MRIKFSQYIPLCFMTALFAVTFSEFLFGDKVLLGTDAVISNVNRSFSEVLTLIGSGWKAVPLLGKPAGVGVNLLHLLLLALRDGVLWNNWYHGLGCLIASVFLLRHLRASGISAWAATLSALAAFWIGVNLTILYAGHPAKPYIVMLFVAALIPIARAISGSVAHSLLWGGCVGLMFVHQPDVATFFAVFAGGYFLFRLVRELGFKSPLLWARALVPALMLAFVFACGPLLSGYKTSVENTVQTQVQTPEQKWNYITQWSFPPEESIAFIAPGYTGWRSGEPEGPYWGRMGRSAGWEQTRQGFQNFKLENMYLGFIPIAFALFALFSCRRSKQRAEILFWGGAAVVALLLSFGKFFPLYSLFYKLPVVNNIRNPNKFLQVFQVCLAILTAYGFDALWRSKEHGAESVAQDGKRKSGKSFSVRGPLTSEPKWFLWFTVGVLGLLILWALSLTFGHDADVSRFVAQGWPQETANVISQNKIMSLWQASAMAAVAAAVFAVFSFPKLGKLLRFKKWIAAGLVLIVAADAVKLSKHYVNDMPRSYIEANALTDFLNENLGYQRVALVQEQQLFGVLKTYTLPYNGIPVFNPGDMSRMPVDYNNFLQAAQKDPLAMWEFSSVKYLLAPASLESQVPAQRAQNVFACTARPTQDGGFLLQSDRTGPFAVFELAEALPRYALFVGSRKMTEEQSLRQIGDLSQLSLSLDSQFPELSGRGQSGVVTVNRYRPGRVTLSVESESGGILRCADRYTEEWKAEIDGEPVAVEPVDYICQGVFVPKGRHIVEMYCDVRKGFFYLQQAGYLTFILALAWSFRGTKKAELSV